MKKLFIDTNIVLDLLAKREPFYESSAKLFSLADRNEIQLTVSSLTFANTNYVLSKLKSASEAKEILRKFKLLVQIVSLSEKIVDLALNDSAFKDFEDGLQYYSAIEYNQDIIITRNQKDFKFSLLSIMSAEEFLSSLS
ncbi:PIN domain-containing protein [Lacihabitans sp. CCS-44]|uniref:type II toxin-antitoxin system VapC family toxin n=1 Tax=Lacihabitans sp. CCS-44 TaxID=2487331 RepID=UPI0020CBA95B|nr:PIN domain-containing protein [Lacihabitans sp. CCS-44]MCP9757484.1 PIN domain-containing protein [Lacihabitans sp. CCS-44]